MAGKNQTGQKAGRRRGLLESERKLRLLVEGVVEPGNTPSFTKLLDLTMLLIPGGKERTEEEYCALLAGARFRLARIVTTGSDVSVIEAVPA